MASMITFCSLSIACITLAGWTEAECVGDYQCKWNERCFPDTKECAVTSNTNHQEGVTRCYLDSYCKSEYVCNGGTCDYKGKGYEHLTDKIDEKGACTDDTECATGYYCKLDRHTCYKRDLNDYVYGYGDSGTCKSSTSCTYNYHCCHDEQCENGKCVAAPADEKRHLQGVTCTYTYHCPSEYTCSKDSTCYYEGEKHAHLPYGVFKDGAQIYCKQDHECPNGYYCKKDLFTCYEFSSRSARSLDCVQRDTCQYHYHCCGHQRCIGSQCRDKAPDEGDHQGQDHWCRYDLDCASEYVCDQAQFTCVYKGPEFAHLPYTYKTTKNMTVRCDKDLDCPGSDYYCKDGTHTCYDVSTKNGAYNYATGSADHIVLLKP